ncbi:MAG TPA: hypothetical protein VEY71_02550 [Chitinophagales bacterium]|nr:hypothetical protein [Chitinophagales bacterium]
MQYNPGFSFGFGIIPMTSPAIDIGAAELRNVFGTHGLAMKREEKHRCKFNVPQRTQAQAFS